LRLAKTTDFILPKVRIHHRGTILNWLVQKENLEEPIIVVGTDKKKSR
jgi:nitrogen fixation protein